MSRRIYPIAIKPASQIGTWSGWPDDVRDTLHSWNRGKGLSFWRGSGVFKCVDCEAFCESHRHGRAVLRGDELCDDCLIARARS